VSDEIWTTVDRYLGDLLVGRDNALETALESTVTAGIPQINVSPLQGKFLHLIARLRGARSILEIGTLAGYSTIWLARALAAGGRLITLEAAQKHADVARANIARAGLADRVEIVVGPALESLPRIAERGGPPFDLVFIDADKPGTPDYFTWALRLTKAGSVIIVDNVVRQGAVADAQSTDVNVTGMRRFLDMLAAERRVNATVIQTVGNKGYDGFAMAVVI